MFRAYAQFTIKYPAIHALNLLIVLSIFAISSYQLLANEALIFAFGFLFVAFPTIVFAKASDYRRKYLNTSN
ncbi:hypothetical protein JCM19237_404 [Photobacterium aphoticum]|uniref:Uncharacterized protein n=1 Tax=Photobacterium aphoticum TaxID=754436 RepID=A0A090R0V6_9GAMM|nr:hypothetical protein JCM19237_404 [Photobacterium aphoticum]